MDRFESPVSAHVGTERLPGRRVLTIREVVRRVGLSRSTLYELVRRGDFPAPLELAPNRVGWLHEEIDAWLASRPRRRRLDRH